MKNRRLYTALAVAGALGPILFFAITLTAQSLCPGYDWVSQTISILAVGDKGWITALALSLFGVLIIALALALFTNIERRKAFRTAIILFILSGIGFILMSIFPTSLRDENLYAPHNIIHQASVGITATLFPIICFLFIPSLKNDRRWHNLFIFTLVAGIVVLALDAGWVILPWEFLSPLRGLYERILTAVAMVWTEIIAVRLLILIKNTKT